MKAEALLKEQVEQERAAWAAERTALQQRILVLEEALVTLNAKVPAQPGEAAAPKAKPKKAR